MFRKLYPAEKVVLLATKIPAWLSLNQANRDQSPRSRRDRGDDAQED